MPSSLADIHTLYDLITIQALQRPMRDALVAEGRRWTYSDLERGTRRLCSMLAERGVAAGDRVLLMAPSSDAFVVPFFALIRLGAIPVPVHPGLREVELLAHARSVKARLLLADSAVDEVVREAFIRAVQGRVVRLDTRRQHLQWQDAGGLEAPLPYFEIRHAEVCPVHISHPDDVAVILHTSGTAGQPQGVCMTHRALLTNAAAVAAALPMEKHPTTAVLLPLHHATALTTQLLATLRIGGTLHLFRNLAFAVPVMHEIQREGTESLVATPVIFRLLADLAASEEVDLTHVRHVSSVGAPLSVSEAQRILWLFPHATLYHHYGLTEAGPRVTTISHRDPRFAQGASGPPIAGTQIRIALEGRLARTFEVGEIWVKGPSLMKTTLDGRAPDPDGWLRTGDVGYLDEDGYLYVQGRREDVLVGGVEKFSPGEVEWVVERHPAVAEAAAVGVADRSGERNVVWVVLRDPADPLDVMRHCERFLAKYKCPHEILTIAQLPRTANGKVIRELLRSWAISGAPAM